MTHFAAIDPGSNFALAIITAPTRVITTTDSYEAFELLKKLKSDSVVGIEAVHAVFGAGSKSTFSFGKMVGFWEGILKYLNITPVWISIPKWQKWAMQKPDRPDVKGRSASDVRKLKKLHKDTIKMESFRAATVAFPDCRLASHDVADAVNMARYLRYITKEGKNEKEEGNEEGQEII